MFHSIKKVESNTGKGYRKIDSKFVIPAKLENQFKSSNGIKDAWTEFRHYTRENSLIHQYFVDFIENEIAPALHTVLKEIGQYKVGLKKNKELRTTILWDYRKRADAVITRLNNDIYATVNQQEKQTSQYIVPKKDPLLTKYGKCFSLLSFLSLLCPLLFVSPCLTYLFIIFSCGAYNSKFI